MQVLFILRQFPHLPFAPNPFNFSVLDRDYNGTGCQLGTHDYSADFKFDALMMKLGFKGYGYKSYGHIYHSYTMGCANDLMNDFHVITETADLPRLHCFHCGDQNDMTSPAWDGDLGGGNERVRMGAINSWFTTHKAQFKFHETYLNPNNCKAVPFMNQCISNSLRQRNHDTVAEMLSDHQDEYGNFYFNGSTSKFRFPNGVFSNVYHSVSVRSIDEDSFNGELAAAYLNINQRAKESPSLLSIIDGIGLNLISGQFCYTPSKLNNLQSKVSIMNQYESVIRLAHSKYYDEWWTKLVNYNVSFGELKSPCYEKERGEGRCEDGFVRRRDKTSNWFLLPGNVCNRRNPSDPIDKGWCITSTTHPLWNTGTSGRTSVECYVDRTQWI